MRISFPSVLSCIPNKELAKARKVDWRRSGGGLFRKRRTNERPARQAHEPQKKNLSTNFFFQGKSHTFLFP
jgi:hypothetical protein